MKRIASPLLYTGCVFGTPVVSFADTLSKSTSRNGGGVSDTNARIPQSVQTQHCQQLSKPAQPLKPAVETNELVLCHI